jgi:4-hydroxybenzoate polyprenyltransferase
MAWATPVPLSGEHLHFQPWHLAGILVCMVGARSAAMAFNRLVDRSFDAENPRTKMRHLPAGLLSTSSVLLFTLASSGLFLAGTLLFLPNWLPVALGLPVLLFLLGYSYAKRFTSLAHFWLGVALMLAPVCVWIALRGEILLAHPMDILPAVILGAAVLAWVAGFDVIYACQDADFPPRSAYRGLCDWRRVAIWSRWRYLPCSLWPVRRLDWAGFTRRGSPQSAFCSFMSMPW